MVANYYRPSFRWKHYAVYIGYAAYAPSHQEQKIESKMLRIS